MTHDDRGSLTYLHVNHGRLEQIEGAVIGETKWVLYLNRRELVSFMCTPSKLHYLALGFLYSERIISSLSDVLSLRVYEDVDRSYWYQPALGLNGPLNIRTCEEAVGVIDVRVRGEPAAALGPRILTTGCTGGVTFDDLSGTQPRLTSNLTVPLSRLFAQMRLLNEHAALYRQVRGVHTSGLGDGERLLVHAEDVGRHNTLDKIRGECLLRGIETRDRLLLATGRISSEMLTKAAKMGVPVIVSRTSPTWLSVRLADAWGITVCGYMRGMRANIYTHPERIVLDTPPASADAAVPGRASEWEAE